jgi:protoheme IX farnesyltransferase
MSVELAAGEHISSSQTEKRTAAKVVRGFYELTKPGITQMVVLTAAVGYYLSLPQASEFAATENLIRFVLFTLGTAFVSAGACTFNHVMERHDDAVMKRTVLRPIPSGLISAQQASLFGAFVTLAGLAMLWFVNEITLLLALTTSLVYLVLYTPLKKRSWLAMFVGGIPGALPAVGGCTAVAGSLTSTSLVLFAIMFVWQMPHFLALAMMYRNDYDRGGFALLRREESSQRVVALHALVYTVILLPVGLMLFFMGVAGSMFAVGYAILSIAFIKSAAEVLADTTPARARRLLLSSYAHIMGAFLLMVIDKN